MFIITRGESEGRDPVVATSRANGSAKANERKARKRAECGSTKATKVCGPHSGHNTAP